MLKSATRAGKRLVILGYQETPRRPRTFTDPLANSSRRTSPKQNGGKPTTRRQ
ncbi:hypothetical protein BIW11_02496 [Tropilaelaps mercedesae]|uniref:Uncharacterized protein n=1 Tax=Tropilaelaps mercedesae TaxID=418985 RepID=A0A1V9Y268_9ACAR|nr:hypothetical protein BIW11_02496 [Tropilaelaps mercedesae]